MGWRTAAPRVSWPAHVPTARAGVMVRDRTQPFDLINLHPHYDCAGRTRRRRRRPGGGQRHVRAREAQRSARTLAAYRGRRARGVLHGARRRLHRNAGRGLVRIVARHRPPAQPSAIGTGQIKVALILPLSATGNAGAAAHSMKNAAEMALAEFNNPNIQLLVKDDGGTAQGAQLAAAAGARRGRRDHPRTAVRASRSAPPARWRARAAYR